MFSASEGELKLSAKDLLALGITCGERVLAASLRALITSADTLDACSGVFMSACMGGGPTLAFSFICTCNTPDDAQHRICNLL